MESGDGVEYLILNTNAAQRPLAFAFALPHPAAYTTHLPNHHTSASPPHLTHLTALTYLPTPSPHLPATRFNAPRPSKKLTHASIRALAALGALALPDRSVSRCQRVPGGAVLNVKRFDILALGSIAWLGFREVGCGCEEDWVG